MQNSHSKPRQLARWHWTAPLANGRSTRQFATCGARIQAKSILDSRMFSPLSGAPPGTWAGEVIAVNRFRRRDAGTASLEADSSCVPPAPSIHHHHDPLTPNPGSARLGMSTRYAAVMPERIWRPELAHCGSTTKAGLPGVEAFWRIPACHESRRLPRATEFAGRGSRRPTLPRGVIGNTTDSESVILRSSRSGAAHSCRKRRENAGFRRFFTFRVPAYVPVPLGTAAYGDASRDARRFRC